MSALVDFRTLQAISDLQALVGDILNRTGETLDFSAPELTTLYKLVTDERCAFNSDASISLWPRLQELAADETAGDDACALSNGILMANALQGGDRQEVAGSLWSGSVTRLRKLPYRWRGPLARAALCTSDRHRFDGDAAPSHDDRLSVDIPGTSERLVKIARSATEEEILHIARADYGCGCDKHLSELRKVIRDQACVFAESQGWYPSEVVELVSHVPTEPGFAVATAVLLNHCIHKRDLQGSTDFRWENNAAAYLAMAPVLRDPVLAGFRAIYELDDGWSPYYSALFDISENRAILLPQPAPELTRL